MSSPVHSLFYIYIKNNEGEDLNHGYLHTREQTLLFKLQVSWMLKYLFK